MTFLNVDVATLIFAFMTSILFLGLLVVLFGLSFQINEDVGLGSNEVEQNEEWKIPLLKTMQEADEAVVLKDVTVFQEIVEQDNNMKKDIEVHNEEQIMNQLEEQQLVQSVFLHNEEMLQLEELHFPSQDHLEEEHLIVQDELNNPIAHNFKMNEQIQHNEMYEIKHDDVLENDDSYIIPEPDLEDLNILQEDQEQRDMEYLNNETEYEYDEITGYDDITDYDERVDFYDDSDYDNELSYDEDINNDYRI